MPCRILVYFLQNPSYYAHIIDTVSSVHFDPSPPPPTQRHKRKLRNSCLDLSLLAPTAGRLTLTFLSIFWNETVLISRNDNGNRKPYPLCWLLVSSELRSTITSWPSFVLCIQNKISIWYDIKWVYNITTLYQGGGGKQPKYSWLPQTHNGFFDLQKGAPSLYLNKWTKIRLHRVKDNTIRIHILSILAYINIKRRKLVCQIVPKHLLPPPHT